MKCLTWIDFVSFNLAIVSKKYQHFCNFLSNNFCPIINCLLHYFGWTVPQNRGTSHILFILMQLVWKYKHTKLKFDWINGLIKNLNVQDWFSLKLQIDRNSNNNSLIIDSSDDNVLNNLLFHAIHWMEYWCKRFVGWNSCKIADVLHCWILEISTFECSHSVNIKIRDLNEVKLLCVGSQQSIGKRFNSWGEWRECNDNIRSLASLYRAPTWNINSHFKWISIQLTFRWQD